MLSPVHLLPVFSPRSPRSPFSPLNPRSPRSPEDKAGKNKLKNVYKNTTPTRTIGRPENIFIIYV